MLVGPGAVETHNNQTVIVAVGKSGEVLTHNVEGGTHEDNHLGNERKKKRKKKMTILSAHLLGVLGTVVLNQLVRSLSDGVDTLEDTFDNLGRGVNGEFMREKKPKSIQTVFESGNK